LGFLFYRQGHAKNDTPRLTLISRICTPFRLTHLDE
jgi:hypothetical protein